MRYLDGPRPRLFAHRGGAREAPENTLEAFAGGLRAGADRLELDVHGTADGAVVVIHDATLDRTTDGTGEVRALPLAEVRACDAGYHFRDARGAASFRGRSVRVPTLAELLERFPGVPLNIEIKQHEPAIEEAVLAVLDRFAARAQVLLAAEQPPIMERIRARAPGMLTGSSVADVVAFAEAWEAERLEDYRHPGAALQVPPDFLGRPLVTAEMVERAHRLGVEVHVWTIDEAGEMERLLALGVDGIMTDLPTVAAAVFAELGLRP
jgi:glycerophosphoryl diester phosphodiesterase